MSIQSDPSRFSVMEVRAEVEIRGSPERIWNAIVLETTAWWHRDLYVGPHAKAFIIEERLGGRVYEDWGGGQGLIWYTIAGLRRPAEFLLLGELHAQSGGPARTQCRLTLEAHGGGTRVTVSETLFGAQKDEAAGAVRRRWEFLLVECLKPFVEDGRAVTPPDPHGTGS